MTISVTDKRGHSHAGTATRNVGHLCTAGNPWEGTFSETFSSKQVILGINRDIEDLCRVHYCDKKKSAVLLYVKV